MRQTCLCMGWCECGNQSITFGGLIGEALVQTGSPSPQQPPHVCRCKSSTGSGKTSKTIISTSAILFWWPRWKQSRKCLQVCKKPWNWDNLSNFWLLTDVALNSWATGSLLFQKHPIPDDWPYEQARQLFQEPEVTDANDLEVSDLWHRCSNLSRWQLWRDSVFVVGWMVFLLFISPVVFSACSWSGRTQAKMLWLNICVNRKDSSMKHFFEFANNCLLITGVFAIELQGHKSVGDLQ